MKEFAGLPEAHQPSGGAFSGKPEQIGCYRCERAVTAAEEILFHPRCLADYADATLTIFRDKAVERIEAKLDGLIAALKARGSL